MFLAMNKTMSNSPNEWMQFYQQDFLSQVAPSGRSAASEAVSSDRSPSEGGAGASASAAAALPAAAPGHAAAAAAALGSLGPSSHLSPEGGVAKPARRRSRASRRTPTTVMNTDTTNFRALVQQFTGGPSAPFGSGPGPGMLSFNFGLGGPGQAGVGRPGGMVPSGFHGQYHGQQQQPHHHQQQLYQQHQNQQYMLSLNTNTPADISLQLQRLASSRSSGGAASDGFGMEGVPPHQVSSRPPPSSSSDDNNNRSNNYIF